MNECEQITNGHNRIRKAHMKTLRNGEYPRPSRAVQRDRTAAKMMARAHGNTLRAIARRLNRCQEQTP
jgi:hypothetical protein